MTLAECYQQHQGTAVSFDGLAEDKGQCLQWVSIVNRDVNGKPAFFTPAAKDWWYKFHGSPLEPFYDQIPRGQPIKKGDFIIYDPLSSTDPQGHIDTASRDGSINNFWAYDSNWDAAHYHDAQGYPTLHEVNHADGFNSKVIGYLRLKGDTMSKVDINVARILSALVLGNTGRGGTKDALAGQVDGDLQQYLGLDSSDLIHQFYDSDQGKQFRAWLYDSAYTQDTQAAEKLEQIKKIVT